MAAPSMEKASSSSAKNSKTRTNEPPSIVKSSSYSLEHEVKSYRNEEDSDNEIPNPSMSKSVSYSNKNKNIAASAMIKSKSYSHQNKKKLKKVKSAHATFNANDNSKKSSKKRRRGRNKAQTNKFLTAIDVGQTVKLTKSRLGFVRFKGKVKFGIGVWYGLEIYDSLTKTRHNGTVFGKRYFNCPRNKGLFVKRDIITEIIPAQKIKKALKELEQKQIKEKKLRNKKKKQEQAEQQQKKNNMKNNNMSRNNRIHNGTVNAVQIGGSQIAHMSQFHQQKNSVLALYQQEFYGNNKLMVKLESEQKENDDEEKIKKDFKRFQRLSFMATNNPEIVSMIQKDNHMQKESDNNSDNDNDNDNEDELKEDPNQGIDIDSEAWDSLKERPIIELLDEINDENDLDLCGVRLFHDFKLYFTEFEYVFNKGLFIKSIDTESKQGRSVVLECGIQGQNGWYITNINDENINKFSQQKVDDILDKLVADIGYDIILRKLE